MTRDASTRGDRAETARLERIYEKMAPRYDRWIGPFERILFGDGRQWVGARAQGDVLEVGIGTGRNIPYYPAGVRLTGVDISEAMLEIASERAMRSRRNVTLRRGDAQSLEFPDGSFDTVVFSLALCSIPDDRRAVAEAKRVLRPGGRIVLLEHVHSPIVPVALMQRLLEPLTVWAEGDHLTREPLDRLQAEGLLIESVERSKLGIVERASARKRGL